MQRHGRDPSFPRRRESKGCQKPPPYSAPSDAQEPRICTGNESKNALTAHFVNPTATCETRSQRSKCVTSALAGTQRLSETDPHSASSDAQTPRMCTGSASKYAPTAHFVHPRVISETANQRSKCIIPAHAGTQRLSETALHSAPSDAQVPRICAGNASKNALTAHFVPPQRPARQPASDRNASFARRREPRGCRKPTLIQRHRMPKCPVYAPELRPNMH